MHSQQLPEILVLLAAAVLVVAVFRLLKLSPVLGYLVAGAAIGPHGFSVIKNVEQTAGVAEFGVVFLLFMIGLELSLERLQAMRKLVFGFGSAQVVLTAVVLGGIALFFGLKLGPVVIVAGGLALSSTAIVLQVIEETGQKSSQVGRISLAVLLMQDLAVVPLLVLVPLLGSHGSDISIGSALLDAGLKAVAAMVVIMIAGRLLLRPVFSVVASFQNSELFLATTLLVVLGTAWLTSMAGLSLALGAFIAGLLVAETEFQHQVEADITPYRGLLLGLFFMTVGMSVDYQLLIHKLWLIAGLSLGLMVIKAGIIIGLFRLFHFRIGAAVQTGLLLSQGGEFAFVLFGLAAEKQVIGQEFTQILLVVTTVTMALTPLAAIVGKKLAEVLEKRSAPHHRIDPNELHAEAHDLDQHVIICGFGRIGQTVAKLLTAEGIGFIALDTDPLNVQIGKKRGKPVYYGDATRADVLEIVGVTRARAAIVALKDMAMAEKAVKALAATNPDLSILARTRDLEKFSQMEDAGAHVTVSELFEGSLQLGGALLRILGVPDHEIMRVIEIFRARNYALTRE